jgi:mannose-6-phosphate isomerase-like protein (cupin superfamily)
MKMKHVMVMAAIAVAAAAATALAVGAAGRSVVLAKGDLVWKAVGTAGVEVSPVSGDMEKGPCRFFLKYPVGLVTPPHHHTPDHYATLVSGSITLNVDGKDHKIGPGSYFALLDKATHTAKVEGNEPAVFFIQAEGPWDVVMEP